MTTSARILVGLLLATSLLSPGTALAACSSYTRYDGSGKVSLCTRCCDSLGRCTEFCS